MASGFNAPDFTGILGNGTVAGELSGASNVPDDLLGPFLGVLGKERRAVGHKEKGNAPSTALNASGGFLHIGGGGSHHRRIRAFFAVNPG